MMHGCSQSFLGVWVLKNSKSKKEINFANTQISNNRRIIKNVYSFSSIDTFFHAKL